MSEIDEIDEMVCELLPDELCRFGYEVSYLSTIVSFSAARDATRAALLAAPPGYVLVPVEPNTRLCRRLLEAALQPTKGEEVDND